MVIAGGTIKRYPPKNEVQPNLFMPAFGDITSRDSIDMTEFFSFSLLRSIKA